MSDLLVNIVCRAADQRTQIDMGEVSPPNLAPLLTKSDAEASEPALGIAVPAFLKLLYENVRNGGFGPGYGLMGLMSGATDDQGHNAVDAYKIYSSSDPSDPTWNWPERLLPICHWGCAMYSCGDCRAQDLPMVSFDPNVHDDILDAVLHSSEAES